MAAGRSQSSRDLAGADIVAGRQESPVAQESVTGEPLVIMSVELNEWVNLFLRWVHVFAGILWVGTTYYFTWLDGRFTELDRKLSKSSPDPQPRPDPNAVHSSTTPTFQHSRSSSRLDGPQRRFLRSGKAKGPRGDAREAPLVPVGSGHHLAD